MLLVDCKELFGAVCEWNNETPASLNTEALEAQEMEKEVWKEESGGRIHEE
jgi:hypothetical protein